MLKFFFATRFLFATGINIHTRPAFDECSRIFSVTVTGRIKQT